MVGEKRDCLGFVLRCEGKRGGRVYGGLPGGGRCMISSFPRTNMKTFLPLPTQTHFRKSTHPPTNPTHPSLFPLNYKQIPPTPPQPPRPTPPCSSLKPSQITTNKVIYYSLQVFSRSQVGLKNIGQKVYNPTAIGKRQPEYTSQEIPSGT